MQYAALASTSMVCTLPSIIKSIAMRPVRPIGIGCRKLRHTPLRLMSMVRTANGGAPFTVSTARVLRGLRGALRWSAPSVRALLEKWSLIESVSPVPVIC